MPHWHQKTGNRVAVNRDFVTGYRDIGAGAGTGWCRGRRLFGCARGGGGAATARRR
nr:hypothetical protein [uncultured Rhodopila sp.]